MDLSDSQQFELDDEATNLYRQLGGIDKADRKGFGDALEMEEDAIDERRVAMVDFVCGVASFLEAVHLGRDYEDQTHDLKNTIEKYIELAKSIYNFDGVLIRFRGYGREGQRENYLIVAGPMFVDMTQIKSIDKRSEGKNLYLTSRAKSAFDTLLELGIHSLNVRFEKSDIGYERLKETFRTIANFYNGLATGDVVKNELGQPDPNLTAIQVMSKIKRDEFDKIIVKVNELLEKNEDAPFANVYETLFAVKDLKDQLVRPLIDINNIRWTVAQAGGKIGPEEAKLSREAAYAFKDKPEDLPKALSSLDDEDYKQATPPALFQKLQSANTLVSSLKTKKTRLTALNRIGKGFNNTPDDTFSLLDFAEGRFSMKSGKKDIVLKTVDEELIERFMFYKKRAALRKKIRLLTCEKIDLTQEEVDLLAVDFNITPDEARRIVEALQSCFSPTGRFLRRSFEEQTAFFVKYGIKLFEFFWRFLGDFQVRNDRVAFLNALQILIDRIPDHSEPLKYLLENFASNNDSVRYSDRNGLILATILLRSYNKELVNNIEVTPEEVLLVKAGLDSRLLGWVNSYFSREAVLYIQKARMLRHELREILQSDAADKDGKAHFLITTIREYYIFMGLTGSDISRKILRSSIQELGDPISEIYTYCSNKEQVKSLLGLLQVSIRGLARFPDEEDTHLMIWLINRADQFPANLNNLLPLSVLEKVIGYADNAIVEG